MKKILIILLFSANLCYSQQIPFSTEKLKYLELINFAEISITKNDYKTAISYFDSAFNINVNTRYVDKYNKALCYRKVGNDCKADSLFMLLAKKGFRNSIIHNCYDTLKLGKVKKEPVVINGINLDDIFERIFNEDQRANSLRYTDMENYANKLIEHSKEIKDLSKEIDNLLAYDYEGKLNFPILHFFQLKGIADRVKSDSLFRNKHIIYQDLEQFDFDKIQFREFLIDEVAKGNYDHESFAQIMSIIGYWFGKPVSQFNDYIIVRHQEDICEDELEEIAKNRKMFGLESYEDFYQKAWYTDSIITKGNPFQALRFDEYVELIMDFDNQCVFDIAEDYRMMMEFNNPEDAISVYNRGKQRLCPQKEKQ